MNLLGNVKVVFAFNQTFVPSVNVSSARCPGGTKMVCILAASVSSLFIRNEYAIISERMNMAATLVSSMVIDCSVHRFRAKDKLSLATGVCSCCQMDISYSLRRARNSFMFFLSASNQRATSSFSSGVASPAIYLFNNSWFIPLLLWGCVSCPVIIKTIH